MRKYPPYNQVWLTIVYLPIVISSKNHVVGKRNVKCNSQHNHTNAFPWDILHPCDYFFFFVTANFFFILSLFHPSSLDLLPSGDHSYLYLWVYKEICLKYKVTVDLKWKNGKHILVNSNQKKARVAVLISDKLQSKEYFQR